jgi:cysteine desulfurase
MAGEVLRLAAIRNELEGRVRKEFPEVIVNSTAPERLPTILNFSFDSARLPMEGEMLVVNLDLAGISASSGSACTSGSVQPSHVLLAMGRPPATAAAAVRFSFGRMSSPEDCERVMTALKDTVRRMRYS